VPTASASDGATISYTTTGAGPALILVHGITDSRHMWDPLVGPLAEDFKVIAVDLRGHGESERRPPYDVTTLADDVHSVVDAVGAIEPLLVGHSLGGAVVSIYAATYPTRGVVNIDQMLQLAGFKDALTSIEPMLRGDAATFASLMRDITGDYGPLSESERARIAAQSSPEQDVVLGVWGPVLTSDMAALDALVDATASAISVPYLALHGRDPGPAYAEWLAGHVEGSTLEVWPDHGHFPHLVEPQRFLDRLHDFAHDTGTP
jgi:pimeloyl-ACP methyl ester carboxylesterase